MFPRFLSRTFIACLLAFSFTLCCVSLTRAQTSDTPDTDDAVNLFQRGQDAHEKGDLARALELYEAAIKLRPEFPEAQYQRAVALVSLHRLADAEQGFRRAIELRGDWALPQAALGSLLVRLKRYEEASKLLERALKLDGLNAGILIALADLRLRTKAPPDELRSLLERLHNATTADNPTADLWAAQGAVEAALGDQTAALNSFDHALAVSPKNISARLARAELRASAGDLEHALEDLKEAGRIAPHDVAINIRLVQLLVRAEKTDDALRAMAALDEATRQLPEIKSLQAALYAQLGEQLRTTDPARSADYFRQAFESEPTNDGYATGYAAALVQARRFGEAAVILRRIIAVAPDNYAAHANLATALYELKRYPEALIEYDWLIEAKPDLAATYFFAATAHDYIGEFPEALAAYEKFLARADAQTFKLEIEKVNLRLPGLRRQMANGEGAKRKKN